MNLYRVKPLIPPAPPAVNHPPHSTCPPQSCLWEGCRCRCRCRRRRRRSSSSSLMPICRHFEELKPCKSTAKATVHNMSETLSQLTSMGFSEAQARNALSVTGGNLEASINWYAMIYAPFQIQARSCPRLPAGCSRTRPRLHPQPAAWRKTLTSQLRSQVHQLLPPPPPPPRICKHRDDILLSSFFILSHPSQSQHGRILCAALQSCCCVCSLACTCTCTTCI
jgi:hypothetical protein